MEQTDKHRPSLLTMVLLILILVPRLLRIGYPRANFADEPLFYLPYLASSGHLPYTDFQCPYNPGWIALLAPLYALLGPSYRVAESVTAMMVVGIALLLYAVGRRRSGRHGGVAAAVLFSWHPLVIGYHVFAVEICVVLCVWSAMHLVLRRDTLSRRDAVLAAVLVTLACTFKKSALSAALAIPLFLLVVRHDRRAAGRFAVSWVAATSAVTLLLAVSFGMAYWEQAFLFHMVKGQASLLWARPLMFARLSADPVSLVGVAGLLLFVLKRKPPAMWLAVMLLCSDLVCHVLLSSTYWSHTHIPAGTTLCFFGGYFVGELGRIASCWRKGRRRGTQPRALVPFGVAAIAVVVIAVLAGGRVIRATYVCHLPYGFGGMSRDEIDTVAAYVRSNSAENDAVFVPGIIALQARRRKMVDNIENAGVIAWLAETVEKQGVLAALRAARGKSFWEMIILCRPYWTKRVEEEFRSGRVRVAVLPGEWAIEYPESLRAPGYTPTFSTPHFTALIPAAGIRNSTSPQAKGGSSR